MTIVANPGELRHVRPVQNIRVTHRDAGNDSAGDEQLMVEYGRGDVAAFEMLYHRYKGALYRYFLRQASRADVAEEMSHEVWLRIIQSRSRYQPTAKFTTYLFQIAHNCLVDFYRKQAAQPAMDGDDHLAAVPDREDRDPQVQAMNRQAWDALLVMIGRLPPEQREVFILKQEAQLSIEDIAYILGENAETVKSRLRYASKKLSAGVRDLLNR